MPQDHVPAQLPTDELYDSRIIKHRLKTGRVKSWAEYDAYLDNLEDCSEYARETESRFEHLGRKA